MPSTFRFDSSLRPPITITGCTFCSQGRRLNTTKDGVRTQRGIRLPTMCRSDNDFPMLTDEVTSPTRRRCQGCTACCVWLPIPAGHVSQQEKPARVACPWLKQNGCGIYPDRPIMCQQFACTWLKHLDWPEEWRPDRSGLLCLTESVFSTVSGSAVYELRPQRLSSEVGQEILKAVARLSNFVVCITVSGHRYHRPSYRWEPPSSPSVERPHFIEIWRKTLQGRSAATQQAVPFKRARRKSQAFETGDHQP